MRVLITGNMGYAGAAVVAHLRDIWPRAWLAGFDAGWFAGSLAAPGGPPERLLDVQHKGDVRELDDSALRGVDAVVHLAAVSNDPIGHRFAEATAAINRDASLRLAAKAAAAGVGAFVFASSCSVYGAGGAAARREGDVLRPLTAYALSKAAAEAGLHGLDVGGMTVTCLRFATACGMSARPRLDLVLNDFVAAALTSGRIEVLSDGTPWRPLIDVRDMARAIAWAIERAPEHGGRRLTVNTGCDSGNHQVAALAHAVAAAVPGAAVAIDSAALPDRRSYRVDFARFRDLAPAHQPRHALGDSIDGLVRGLCALGFDDPLFRRSPEAVRLHALAALVNRGALDGDLRWRVPYSAAASTGRRCNATEVKASNRAIAANPPASHGRPSYPMPMPKAAPPAHAPTALPRLNAL